MNRFVSRLVALVLLATLSPLCRGDDALEAHRKAAEAAVMPHAAIPASALITDEVLARVPADSEYFRKFLQRIAGDLAVSVIFPPKALDSDYHQALVEPVGSVEMHLSDGHHTDINVLNRWTTWSSKLRPKTVASIEFFLVIGYDLADGQGSLILPCSADVVEDEKQVYSCSHIAVDLRKMSVVTRPKK